MSKETSRGGEGTLSQAMWTDLTKIRVKEKPMIEARPESVDAITV